MGGKRSALSIETGIDQKQANHENRRNSPERRVRRCHGLCWRARLRIVPLLIPLMAIVNAESAGNIIDEQTRNASVCLTQHLLDFRDLFQARHFVL